MIGVASIPSPDDRPRRKIAAALLALAWLAGFAQEPIRAQDAEPEAVVSTPQGRLDAIHQDLVELRFEKALAAIEALLTEPGLAERERTEALILRSQAHVAFGDLAAAEQDYREILRRSPGYTPDESLTPRKAMQRFEKVRAELIGTLRIAVDPPDARITVDGVPAIVEDGAIAVLAGEHVLVAQAPGHDPFEHPVEVTAGGEQPVEVSLTPNARTVMLETEPEGVEVRLDGVVVGRTERVAEAGRAAPARLILENVPLGSHVFELRRECYRATLLEEVLTVDLLDRSPRRLGPVRLIPARSTLMLQGGPVGGEVVVDGRRAGRLPLETYEVCPGERRVEVRFADRVVWAESLAVREASELPLEIRPRPNAALVGVQSWPPALAAFGEAFNLVVSGLPLPSRAELSTAEGWADVELPDGTDLALAVIPKTRSASRDRWWLYSPILRSVVALEAAPDHSPRPRWEAVAWGFATVDSDRFGSPLVIDVTAGSGAAGVGLQAGDRIVRVGERAVGRTADVHEALRAAEREGRVELEWVPAAGEPRSAVIRGSVGPELAPKTLDPIAAAERAAWALADVVAAGERAPNALANLAQLLSRAGQPRLAADAWRRVRWSERAGIGEGTRQYYLGIELARLGEEAGAVAAFRAAAGSRATAFADDGPAVAPAAEDHLADLGESPR